VLALNNIATVVFTHQYNIATGVFTHQYYSCKKEDFIKFFKTLVIPKKTTIVMDNIRFTILQKSRIYPNAKGGSFCTPLLIGFDSFLPFTVGFCN